MAWFHQKPKQTKNFKELTKAYNQKYGDFDYSQDSRALDRTFTKYLLGAVGDLKNKKVLVCGANSGYEIKILKKKFSRAQFTAVDVSNEALAKLPRGVKAVHANFENLPFRDREFDMYVNCRAMQSSNVNLARALKEARRVSKGRLVISIPNGYVVNGKLIHGMYDYETKLIDPVRPWEILKQIERTFVQKSQSDAELFLSVSY